MNKTIYYAEDDDICTLLMEDFFKQNFGNYELKTFELISDAMTEIEKTGFPIIVITDYNMPTGEPDGEAFIRWMNKKNFDKYIAWTNNPEELKSKFKNAHLEFDCINKIDFKSLLLSMNRILKTSKH